MRALVSLLFNKWEETDYPKMSRIALLKYMVILLIKEKGEIYNFSDLKLSLSFILANVEDLYAMIIRKISIFRKR